MASVVVFFIGCDLTIHEHITQAQETEELRHEILSIQTAVRHVSAQVNLDVTALWSDGRGPGGILTQPFPGAAIVRIIYKEPVQRVLLHATGSQIITEKENSSKAVSYEAASLQDSSIIGRSIADFEQATELQFVAMFTVPNSETKDDKITVRRVSAEFKVNGNVRYRIQHVFSPPTSLVRGRLLHIPLDATGLRQFRVIPFK